MLKRRIIPRFLYLNGRFVKLQRFNENLREAGNPVSTSKIYQDYGADELMILNINDPADKGMDRFADTIGRISREIFMPLTVGGGIRTLEDIRALLNAGADKVSLCTAAVADPDFLRAAVLRFGSSTISTCVDYRETEGRRPVFIENGRSQSAWDALDLARHLSEAGAGEIILNAIDRDGMMAGYDLSLVRAASAQVGVPVVASGGAGSLEDCRAALEAGADAITVSSLFIFSDHSPIKIRSYLHNQGVEVRASKSSRN